MVPDKHHALQACCSRDRMVTGVVSDQRTELEDPIAWRRRSAHPVAGSIGSMRILPIYETCTQPQRQPHDFLLAVADQRTSSRMHDAMHPPTNGFIGARTSQTRKSACR
jgi:hypothetical protein